VVDEIAEPVSPDGAATTTESRLSPRTERIFEGIATVILAVATLGVAWSGYQATRWNGVQAADYVTASGLRVKSSQASTAAGQDRLFDSQVFSQWLNAYAAGNSQLAELYKRRFRPEFVPAFEAWLATDPLNNASAPPGPLYMPQYVSAKSLLADQLERQADAAFDAGQDANEWSDEYVLNTVFLASALFLAGIAGRFSWRTARAAILVMATIALGVGIINVIRLPIN
jgi:hypothetical protein